MADSASISSTRPAVSWACVGGACPVVYSPGQTVLALGRQGDSSDDACGRWGRECDAVSEGSHSPADFGVPCEIDPAPSPTPLYDGERCSGAKSQRVIETSGNWNCASPPCTLVFDLGETLQLDSVVVNTQLHVGGPVAK